MNKLPSLLAASTRGFARNIIKFNIKQAETVDIAKPLPVNLS
jgi:hypothetical protein